MQISGRAAMSRKTLETLEAGLPSNAEVLIQTVPQRRLLIVDDRELTCQQLQQILQSDVLDVEYRTDGHQALKALQDSAYSILLTDLKMPEMSGMDLIREVQKRGTPITI